MTYYDIHTHTPSDNTNTKCIISHSLTPPQTYPNSFSSIGLHPWDIKDDSEEQLNFIESIASNEEIIAIGEAGLDKLTSTPIDVQIDIFRQQALLAKEINKPLIIHCVKAWNDLILIHREIEPTNAWIVHGFRGGRILAKQLIEEGLYLSFGYHFNEDAVKEAWKDHLLTETDDKDIQIQEIYKRLADVLRVPISDFSKQIEDNIEKLFPSLIGK